MTGHPSQHELLLHAAGELSGATTSSIAAHLDGCAACRASVDELRAVEARCRHAAELADGASAAVPLPIPRRHRPLGFVAALLVIAAVSWLSWPATPATADPVFMLIIREPVAERLAASDFERQRRSRDMRDWVDTIRTSGRLIGGEKLVDDAGLVVTNQSVSDGTGQVPRGMAMTGFLLVSAQDAAHALRLARACPVLALGGQVDVRAIE